MNNVINLRQLFQKRFRISFDPAYDARGRPKDNLDPWMMELRGRYGNIYPFDDGHLVVEIDDHNQIAKRVADLPGCEVIQNGDFEKAFKFPLELFDQIAEIVRPHRKRQFSDEQRDELRERMTKIRSHSPINSPISGSKTHAEAVT